MADMSVLLAEKSMGWMQFLNALSLKYEPLLNAANVIGLLVLALFSVVFTKIYREKVTRNLSSEERKIFNEVLSKISEARSLIFQNGEVTDKAHMLYWQARDQARLILPDDIYQYTEKLRATANKAYTIKIELQNLPNGDGEPIDETRRDLSAQYYKQVNILIDDEPSQLFRAYMRIKNK